MEKGILLRINQTNLKSFSETETFTYEPQEQYASYYGQHPPAYYPTYQYQSYGYQPQYNYGSTYKPGYGGSTYNPTYAKSYMGRTKDSKTSR